MFISCWKKVIVVGVVVLVCLRVFLVWSWMLFMNILIGILMVGLVVFLCVRVIILLFWKF